MKTFYNLRNLFICVAENVEIATEMYFDIYRSTLPLIEMSGRSHALDYCKGKRGYWNHFRNTEDMNKIGSDNFIPYRTRAEKIESLFII